MDLISILREAHVGLLVDVRAYPTSKRHPHFCRDALAASLREAAIAYEWQGKALAARPERVCIMCAESDPADCHRRHIADWLAARGHRVVHLLAPGSAREHALHPQEELWRDV